jgi:hypothetical protein
MSDKPTSPTRPVTCSVCKEQMFYEGFPGHEPEITLEIQLPKWQEPVLIKHMENRNILGKSTHYIHVRCWNYLPIVLHGNSFVY